MKRTAHYGIALGCALVGAMGVAVSCGGKVASGPPGTLDDAGVFHEPDGHILFAPGSACMGYAAARYIEVTSVMPSCTDPSSVDGGAPEESASCEAWMIDAGLSFGYLPYAACRSGHCADVQINSRREPAMSCTWGSEGNAYCRAFFQQFLLRGSAAGDCTTFDNGKTGFCNSACTGSEAHVVALEPDGAVVFSADGGGDLPGVGVSAPGNYTNCEPICLP